jgi:hypothetical protein
MSWPDTPDAWLEDYVVWRINSGKLTTRPTTVPPPPLPPYADEFLYWCIWRRKGRPLPRPTTFPPAEGIKKWAYVVLDGVNQRAPIQIPGTDVCPHSWVLAWAIWRFKNEPDPKPPTIPKEPSVVAPYIWSFLNWAAWRRKLISFPNTPRPKNLPENIPPWCFNHLKQINQAVKPGPPPPPPPPPDPEIKPPSWTLPNPLLYTTWGWQSDWVADDTMLRKARDAGIKSIGLQGGQYGPDVPQRCRNFGFKTFLWGRARPQDAEDLIVGGLDGYMPQIEGPGEHVDAVAALEAGAGQGLSRGTVTTLGAFTSFIWLPPSQSYPEGRISTKEVEELKKLGVNYGSVEVYKQEGPHFPISTMMWSAKQRGLDYFDPLLGLYWETSIKVYEPPEDPMSLKNAGRQLGFYMAEGFIPLNWQEVASLGT